MWTEGLTERSPGSVAPTIVRERYGERGEVSIREVRGEAFVPDPLPPSRVSLTSLLADHHVALLNVERSVGLLAGMTESRARPVPDSVLRLATKPLIRREAIASSRIEQTYSDAQDLAIHGAGARASRPDTREVANYVAAMEHGLASTLPLCMRLVREMHEILMNGVRGGDAMPGTTRSTQNWIRGRGRRFEHARYVPPPPGPPLDACLGDLEVVWNSGIEGYPWLFTNAVCHYQFEAIHPFGDGNGRLGRLLILLMMIRGGVLRYPLVHVSGYFEHNRSTYYDRLLNVTLRGEWSEWIGFFAQAVEQQATEADGLVSGILEERERVRGFLIEGRAPERLLGLVDHLIEQPAISAAQVAKMFGVSNPTARKDIARLVNAGFLSEVTGKSYGRVYVARRILDLTDDEAWV